MKKFFKCLSLITAFGLGLALTACAPSTEGTTGAPSTNESTSGSSTTPIEGGSTNTSTGSQTATQTESEDTITYSVVVKAVSGAPVRGAYVTLMDGDKFITDNWTDNKGVANLECKAEGDYEIQVELPGDLAKGYILKNPNRYVQEGKFGLDQPYEFYCETQIIDAVPNHDKVRYTSGDVMYDFTITDFDGTEYKLSELFDTYKAVYLNFWVLDCGNCLTEFPYISESFAETSSYGRPYSDDIKFLAVNPTDRNVGGKHDELNDIIKFKDDKNYSFDIVPDYNIGTEKKRVGGLSTLFNVQAFPITVIIDRFGNISEIETGAITSHEEWKKSFEEYISEDYEPKYHPIASGDDEVELTEPNVDMPSSETLLNVAAGTNHNGEKFSTVFEPESGTDDAKYAWPFVVSQDGTSIVPSNTDVDNSYAMLHFNVSLLKDEVFSFKYFSSTEKFEDVMYVLVDGIIITNMSGKSEGPDFEDCFAYVANRDDTYRISLIYRKNAKYSDGDDTVYINNMRVLKSESINKETYIYREASEEFNDVDNRYDYYVDTFYNEADGYYHVGSKTGAILMIDFLSGTNWNPQMSLFEMSWGDTNFIDEEGVNTNPKFIINGVNYNTLIQEYAVYCRASILGYCPVTKEIHDALIEIVKEVGIPEAKDNPDQWLELCVYYNAYGTNGVELESSVRGVTTFDSFKLDAAKGEALITYDRIVEGFNAYVYEFKPTVSGVYKFESVNTYKLPDNYNPKTDNATIESLKGEKDTKSVTGFDVSDEDDVYLWSNDDLLRSQAISVDNKIFNNHFESHQYYEAGKTYYIRFNFNDIFELGRMVVRWTLVGDDFEQFKLASGPFFTTPGDGFGEGNFEDNIISIGIPVELKDGYYHAAKSNANDTFIYFDATYTIDVFDRTGMDLVNHHAFDFTLDEHNNKRVNAKGEALEVELLYDPETKTYYEKTNADGSLCYKSTIRHDESGNPIIYEDLTEEVRRYLEDNLITEGPAKGCVKVNARFAQILQMLMDKYTFEGVSNSWLKVVYYSAYVGVKNK